MNKKIESILLSEDERKLNKIDEFTDGNYKDTIKEMLNILIYYIKNKSIQDVYLILYNIEQIILSQDIENYKILNNAIREASYNISNLCNKEINNKEIKKINLLLKDINRKLLIKKESTINKNLYDLYYYVIFDERNLDITEMILKNDNDILNKKDSFGNDILTNIIYHYCFITEEEDIKYFYETIILFLKYLEDKISNQYKENCFELLNKDYNKNKKHISEIKARFQESYLVDEQKLEKKYNIYTKFSDKDYEQAKKLKFNKVKRKKLNYNFVTIDDEEALCLDDAISLVENKDGSYYYYVAITDIPSIINYESSLYYEAMKRVETIYLCDKAISLYPEVIANDKCSLLAGRNKNVILYKFFVDPDYDVDIDNIEIKKGIINVKNRLNYKQVNKQENIDVKTINMLNKISMISLKLKSQNRIKEKYRRIENLINSEAIYHHSMFSEKSISANIIQESMLLVNHSAAKYFQNNNLVYLYRTHSTSNNLENELEKLLSISSDDPSYQKLIAMVKESYLTASYGTVNRGHKGLNYDSYSHSTSAARRFADSFNQYLTYFQIFNRITDDKKLYELEQTANEIATHINEKKKENNQFASEYNYLASKKLIRKR